MCHRAVQTSGLFTQHLTYFANGLNPSARRYSDLHGSCQNNAAVRRFEAKDAFGTDELEESAGF